MTLTLEIPLPPKGCSPNNAGHEHFQVRAAANEWHRDQVKTIAAVSKPKYWVHQKVCVSTVWYMGPTVEETTLKAAKAAGQRSVRGIQRSWAVKYRPLDSSNANSSLKAAIDALVDAGIVPRDDHKWVKVEAPTLYRTAKEHKGRACIVMTIEQVEGLF